MPLTKASRFITGAAQTFAPAMSELMISLQRAGCPEDQIKAIVKEANTSFEYLKKLAARELSEEDFAKEMRAFLLNRSDYILGSPADYFSLTFSPINQICLQIISEIASEDEALIKLIAKDIEVEYYDLIISNLKEITEKTNSQGKREIDFTQFKLSKNKKAVIPVLPWFENKIKLADKKFNHHLYLQNTKWVPLEKEEVESLRNALLPFSSDLLDKMDERERLLNTPDTLAAAIILLKDILHANGAGAGNLGTSSQMAPGGYYALRDFFAIWNNLNPSTRDRLGALTRVGCRTIAFHLEILESGLKKVSAEKRHEYETHDNYGTCVQVNSSNIVAIMNDHLEQFTAIKLNDTNSQLQKNSVKKDNSTKVTEHLYKNLETKLEEQLKALKLAVSSSNINAKVIAYKPTAENDANKITSTSRYTEYAFNLGATDLMINSVSLFYRIKEKYSPADLNKMLKNTPVDSFAQLLIDAIHLKDKALCDHIRDFNPHAEKQALHYFILNNNNSCLRTMLSFGFQIDTNNVNLLLEAVQHENFDIISILLALKMEVNRENQFGDSALYILCSNIKDYRDSKNTDPDREANYRAIFSLLIQYGADIHLINNYHLTPLKLLMKHASENDDLLAIAIEKGISLNSPQCKNFLLFALKHNLIKSISAFFNHNSEIDKKDENGLTVLHHVCVNQERIAGVQLLLDLNANIHLKDNEGNTALHHALSSTIFKPALFKLLIASGADFHALNNAGETALMKHIKAMYHPPKGQAKHSLESDSIQACLDAGLDPNFEFERTNLLFHAAYNAYDDIVSYLLNKGVDVNQKNKDGNTPLHAVCGQWFLTQKTRQIIKLLVEKKGIQVNALNHKNMTPLQVHLASPEPESDIIADLIHCGANFIGLQHKNLSLFLTICKEGHIDIASAMLERSDEPGFDINQTDENGHTALYFAIIKKHTQIVNLLIEKGADVNKKGPHAKTPLDWMIDGRNADGVRLLISKKALFKRAQGDHSQATVEKLLHDAVVQGNAWLINTLIEDMSLPEKLNLPNLDSIYSLLKLEKTAWKNLQEHLLMYASVVASRLEHDPTTQRTMQQKARSLREAIRTEDPLKIFYALKRPESQSLSFFWSTHYSRPHVADMPSELTAYYRQEKANAGLKSHKSKTVHPIRK